MARIAWVEDDPTIRKLVHVALRALPHELHFATNGQEGLAMIERVRPDIVFTDVAMPLMDGIQMVDALRSRPELAGTPVVFVTASLQKEQIERYFAHGATAYLAKPFSTAELRERIERLIPR